MSYILDALRKSEQQRLRGVAPGLMSVHMPAEADPQPAYLIYGLIATALIGAGVAIGWWRPWQQAQTFSAPGPLPPGASESRPPPALPEPPPRLPEASSRSSLETPVQEPAALGAPPVPAPDAAPTVQHTDLRARAAAETRKLVGRTLLAPPKETAAAISESATPLAVEKTVTPVRATSAGAAPADAAQQQKVIAMAELPPAILRELPAMSVSGYTYSSAPGERIVGINDRLLQEGDYVAPGLKLEKIAADGLVFSYKKFLFRRGFQ